MGSSGGPQQAAIHVRVHQPIRTLIQAGVNNIMDEKIPVGVLAATGAVGQRFCALLEDHPWFEIAALTASERSAGKTYAEAVSWVVPGEIPPKAGRMRVLPTEPFDALVEALGSVRLLFSALPSDVAKQIEPALTEAGFVLASNASALRMVHDVPLMIPEVNADHIALLDRQRARLGSGGFAVAMANCSSTGIVIPLKALDDAFGVERVHVVTLQAISGAGYPGVSSFDIVDNVIPFISNEEDKIESEPRKMLGRLGDGEVIFHDMQISAQVHRVPVMDGHTAAMSVKLKRVAALADVLEALDTFTVPEAVQALPSAPERALVLRREIDRPQPRRDRDSGNGMTVSVGRVQPCPVFDYKLVSLSHNTLRGAAGGAILAGEWMVASGYLEGSTERMRAGIGG